MKFSVRFVPSCLLLTAATAVDAKRLGGPTLAAADVDGLRKLQIGSTVLVEDVPAGVFVEDPVEVGAGVFEAPVDVGAVVVGNGIPVAGGNGGANAPPPPPPALDLPVNTFPGDYYQDVNGGDYNYDNVVFPEDTYANDGDYNYDNYGPNGGRPAFDGPPGRGNGYYQQEGLTAGVGAVDYYEEEYFEPGQGQGGGAVDYYEEEYFEPGQGQGGAAVDYYEEEQGYYEQEGLTAGVGAVVEDVAVGVIATGPAFPEDTYENNYYGEDEQGYYEDVGGDYDYDYDYDYRGNSQTVSGTGPNGGYYAGTTGTGPYGGYTYENVAAGRPSGGGGGGGGSYQSSYITGPGGGYMGGATSTRPGGLTRPPYSSGGGAYSYGTQYGRPSSSASGGAYGSGYGGGGRGYGGYTGRGY